MTIKNYLAQNALEVDTCVYKDVKCTMQDDIESAIFQKLPTL